MLCDVVHESSHFMQRDFGEITQLQNSKKGTNDFTNKCYKRIQGKLLKSISEKRPNYSIITSKEELPQTPYSIVIEPISGINNFKRSIPFCAIAAALFEQGEPVAVVIHNPILRETFYAAKGLGAWHENYNETIVPKSRIRVSNQNNFEEALIISTLNNSSLNLGCTLLEIAYLAASRLDIVIKKNDNLLIKGASLLVREAGGLITLKNELFLASNDCLNKQAIETLLP